MRLRNYIALCLLLLFTQQTQAQSLPVGSILETYIKQLTLQNQLDSNRSFTHRPLALESIKQSLKTRDTLADAGYLNLKQINTRIKNASLTMLPFRWEQQVNTHHPYGWNDGAMIPAKGYQTLLSGGVHIKYGPLSVQFQPEYVWAANTDFETTGIIKGGTDQPERFGTGNYSKAGVGQSYIQLQVSKFALKLSNENIWWGPGVRNALLLSNHADGFAHLSLQSVAPLKTPIGSVEFQLIGGKLRGSDADASIRKEWRYFSGMHLTYQPRWIPGLFFGLTRSFQAYHSDVEASGEYFPYLTPYQKINTDDGDPIPRDQLTSVYAKWLFPKAHAEVYVEFGKNDNAWDFRDFLGSPEHARAYLFGFRKLVPLKQKESFISVQGEFTQLSQTIDRILRPAGAWYYHSQVKQGMTHNGQVLGAGIGSGSNLQSLDISWIRGMKSLGFRLERLVQDQDYYNAAIGDYNNQSRRWVDYSFALLGRWNWNKILINSELNYIRSLNYQWRNLTPAGNYLPIGKDVNNLHLKIGLNYFF
ncbi:MAG: hypothetical protein RI924_1283 [Bacteroidota bacterium]|jgi:hypothetical protein